MPAFVSVKLLCMEATTTKRKPLGDFRGDGVETEQNIRRRYSRIYESVKKIKGSEDIKTFVFSCGFDGDRGLGAGLNQSSVDFILWLASSYHELIHIFRCGAQGKDQVENMAKKLYGPDGFFHDIHKYVGKSPVFVESLPTANSVADPDGVIKFLKKSGMLEDATFGYVGAACWETKRILPYDLPVPEHTVHGEPMGTVYYENRDGSMRDKVMLLLKYGRPAYKELFERLDHDGYDDGNRTDLHSCFLGASYGFLGASYSYGNFGSAVVMKDHDPPEGETETLFWCIVQTLNYYRTYVMALDVASQVYKNDFLMEISSWDLGLFVQHMKDFYKDPFHRSRVLRYLAQKNYAFIRNPFAVFEMLDKKPLQSTQVLCLFSFCFNIKFNIYKVEKDGNLHLKTSHYPFPVDFGGDAALVRQCAIITVNLLPKRHKDATSTYSVLFQDDYGFTVVPINKEVVNVPSTDNDASQTRSLPPLPPLPDAQITVDLSLKADSETLPGLTHYSEVDWNEYLSPPKQSDDVLDRNALKIIENALRVPVKTHMANTQTRYEIMEVDSKYYSPLLGWTVTGFRGSMVPSGMVQCEDKEIALDNEDCKVIFSDHVKKQRFFKAFLSDTLKDQYGIPKYAYNLKLYTTSESRGVRYANNYLREKSEFDYHFYDLCQTSKVQLKIKPTVVDGTVRKIEVSLSNAFIPGRAVHQSEYCQHRHKLIRTDWCGEYQHDAKHDCFKYVIKDPLLYPFMNTETPLSPARGEPAIQAEASYYLFFNRTVRRFCILNQYQFLRQTNLQKQKFPWNQPTVKSLAFSNQYQNSYYNEGFWSSGEFTMDFYVKGAVPLNSDFNMTLNPDNPNEYVFKHRDIFYELRLKMRPPMRNLKISYTVDEEIMKELEETFEVKLPSLQDKAKMWYSFMQSRPWTSHDGIIAHKRALDDLDQDETLEEGDRLTWMPDNSNDKWEFLDEKETKLEQEGRERLNMARKSKTKQILRDGIQTYANKMNIPGKMFWHGERLYIESNNVVNAALQTMFYSNLQQALPLKRGEMDLCIPIYRMHFEAQSFLDLGYLDDTGKTALLYNMCMSLYIALLSLWLQPNAYNQLEFRQLMLLNHQMADEWSSFQRFFESIEERLHQPAIKRLLIRDKERQTYTVKTWKFEPRGVLRCVVVQTNDSYSKDLLLLANRAILDCLKRVKERPHDIRQKVDLDFMHDLYQFDEVYRSVEPHLTVVPPTIPSPLPDVYQQILIHTPDKRIPFVSFEADYLHMGEFRFEEATARHFFVDFNPPESDDPAVMSKYVDVYISTFEACSNLSCLYMICMMIKYPTDPKYQKYRSRAFHSILNKIWIQVFQQYMGYTIERTFAAVTDKIHDTMCWCVRNAFKHMMFKDSKGFIFSFTASEARRLKQNHSFIDRDFILNLWHDATGTRSVNFYSTEWSFGNLQEGIGFLKNLTKNRVMSRLKIAENRWDAVMLAIFNQLNLTKQQREIIKANVEGAFQRSPGHVSTEQYNKLKAMVDCDWSYDAQRDIFRDALHELYVRQIEQLRIVNSRESVTHFYNTINFRHVKLLRDTKKAYDKEKKKELWKLNPFFVDRFRSVFLRIDRDRFTSGDTPTPPSLPESNARSKGDMQKSQSREINSDGIDTRVETAVPVGAMNILSGNTNTVANNLKVRQISRMVDAYSSLFSPLISPNMPSIEEDDQVRFSRLGWSGLFSDPFEYNLGIYKLKKQGYDICKEKNVRIFDVDETSLFIQRGGEGISDLERYNIKHAIFFTASGNVFHYIRSIPLTLKQYWFDKTQETLRTFEKLAMILKTDPSITKGSLFKENIEYMKQQRLNMIHDALHSDDLPYDESVDTAVLRGEIKYVKETIQEIKKGLERLHNDSCPVSMTDEESKLRLQLAQMQTKSDRMQGRTTKNEDSLKSTRVEMQQLSIKIDTLEKIREQKRKALLETRDQSIDRDSRYLGTLEENLHNLQTEIADLPFKRNEQLLLDQIAATEELLRKSKIAGSATEEIEEFLRQQQTDLQENKKNHEAKMHLMAEIGTGLREDIVTRELARIKSKQDKIQTQTRDEYHSFLLSQMKVVIASHKPPDIQQETADLRDLLVHIPVVSANTWLAPLWFVELFLRECDSANHTIIYRKFADWVKRRVGQSTVEIESYCNCVMYFLSGIKQKQGDFRFVPLRSDFDKKFDFNKHHFLQYDFSDRTREVLTNANSNDILEAICSAVNLDVDVYEPYQNLKCALVAEPDSTQFSSTIMLNASSVTTHKSKSQFYFDERTGSLKIQNIDVQQVASFRLPDHYKRSVVRGHNKPVFYVDFNRKRLVKNLGWDDGSEKNSFFKSLAHDGLFSDHVSASCEFVACMIRSISKRMEDNKHAFNDIVTERLTELHTIFECELKAEQSPTKTFHKLYSNQLWAYYCRLLCAALPASIIHLSDYLLPTKSELQCFCDQAHAQVEIFNVDNEREFSVLDFSKGATVVEDTTTHSTDKKPYVIQMLYFPPRGNLKGAFGRLIDCALSPPSSLPEKIRVFKTEDADVLGIAEGWERTYIRLSQRGEDIDTLQRIRESIRSCEISDVFNDDIFISESSQAYESTFVFWRVSDSWFIHSLQQFYAVLTWLGDGIQHMKSPDPLLIFTARIDYTADVGGQCDWYLKNNSLCKISVVGIGNHDEVSSKPATEQAAEPQPADVNRADSKVNPFKLHLLNPSCSSWPSKAQDPDFSRRFKGLSLFRQDSNRMVPMRLWQANEGYRQDMTEDNTFQGITRRRRGEVDRRARGGQESDSDDSSDDSDSSDDGGGAARQSKRAANFNRNNGGSWDSGKGGFDKKIKNEKKKSEKKQSEGKGGNSEEKRAGGGWGTGKHNRVKDFVEIQQTGTKRGGQRRKAGAKNICPNRMFGHTLFGDPRARNRYFNYEGDRKVDHYEYFKDRENQIKEAQREEADDLRRRALYAAELHKSIRTRRGVAAEYSNECNLHYLCAGFHSSPDLPPLSFDYAVINEDLKPNYMLTTGLFESIVTLETFGFGDCVSIKLIQGMNEECMTLALFLSCFFYDSATLCMFDQFTDNLTFAGKGYMPEMARFWGTTDLLLSVADITPEQFVSLREKIPSIWQSRQYFLPFEDRKLDWHDHDREIRENSTKLWWAHHRSLSIAALAFVMCSLYGRVWDCKYITEEEAWKATKLLHKKTGSADLLSSLRQSPFGSQLRAIYDMAEYIAVQHPTRSIYTRRGATHDFSSSADILTSMLTSQCNDCNPPFHKACNPAVKYLLN